MIREAKSSPCYEEQHEKCRYTYSGQVKRYNADKAEFYYEPLKDFRCGCNCHPKEGRRHA